MAEMPQGLPLISRSGIYFRKINKMPEVSDFYAFSTFWFLFGSKLGLRLSFVVLI